MAETTVLRANAINRSPNAGAKPQAQLSGRHPVVQVNMNAGGAQVQGGRGAPRQGVVLLPPKGGTQKFTTGGLPNQPAKPAVTVFPLKGQQAASSLTAEQLMLCRHLADKYLREQRSSDGEELSDNGRLAEETVAAIDAAIAALTAAAAAAAAPAPRVVSAGVRSMQAATHAAPRRVSRPGGGLPPVSVKMDGGQPVLQTEGEQAAIDVESSAQD